ncbi:MAG: PIN domain-containing protein [Anaerolineae bacterium]
MPKLRLFLDSSALIAGIVSPQGAARALLLLGEAEKLTLILSEQVIAEVERNIARKAAQALPFAREMILRAKVHIVCDPLPEEVRRHRHWISHQADVPIIVAAAQSKVHFLVTLDSHHFLEDTTVTERSGLRLGTPGDALAWVREQLADTGEKGL